MACRANVKIIIIKKNRKPQFELIEPNIINLIINKNNDFECDNKIYSQNHGFMCG